MPNAFEFPPSRTELSAQNGTQPNCALPAAFLRTTVSSQGVPVTLFNITISALALVAAVLLICWNRFDSGKPLIPAEVLRMPAIQATLVYFAIGLCTFFAAQDKLGFTKEVKSSAQLSYLFRYLCSL